MKLNNLKDQFKSIGVGIVGMTYDDPKIIKAFDKKWNTVFCYGKEVDDFHTLDKQKLFALNFSATQELDRKVIALEAENAELKAKIQSIEQRLAYAGF